MAGIFLSISPEDPERAGSIGDLLKYFDDETQQTVTCEEFTCIWSGINDVDLWGPAVDPHSGNRVITSGRISFEEGEWQKGERLTQYDGGLASRILLHRFKEHGIDGLLRHNGPAAVIVWDNSAKRLHLLTDHLGYHPVFLYQEDAPSECVISTSPDVMARDKRIHANIDDVSIAEFLSAWRATPPNTYYIEIKYAGAACHHTWDLRTNVHSVREYWRPFQDDFYRTSDEGSDALADALSHSIHIRTLARLGPIVCFASGGLDSRAVLIGASKESELVALNLYDVPGKDAQTTQRLCASTQTRYVGFGRDREYYPRLMQENVRVGNGMWSLEDQHYLGTREIVGALGARTVLSACTTDWVFKGYGLEKTYRKFLGKNLPIQKLTSRRLDEFLPNHRITIADRYRRRIDERYEEWTGELPRNFSKDRDWLEAEDKRVRPACYAVSVSGGIMYRIFPYDTFLGDRAIADCYGRMPARWKLNSKIWGMAVRKMGGSAGRIPDSGSGFSPGDSTPMQVLKFGIGWAKRRLPNPGKSDTRADTIVTNGSWPNYGWCIRNSKIISRDWHEAPLEHREFLSEIFGHNLWQEDLGYWSERPNDCFRLLTMLNWLRSTGDGA